ncbi:ATP-binding protein [Sagittula salina]|uniref:histidine kinase n=1 Tax=Sagittula salina TaxID=2820268 RepID=A0A940MSK7_9RHOB|nr:ATP-binding protein [Sagittula salina]MBP0485055.1 PAS domain S-box protein [Sagittula salina]
MIRIPFLDGTMSRGGEGAGRSDLKAALLESEARYRVLFEAIDDGFCVIQFTDGPDGPLTDYVHIEANSGYARHTGISGIVGKTVFDVAPNDGREWVKLFRTVLDTGKPIRFEREFSEVGRFIEVAATRVEPASLHQVAVLFRDITDRKRAEAELRASEKRARENEQRVHLALAAGAIVGTWVWEIPTDSFVVDDSFCGAMGLDAAQDRDALSVEIIVQNVHPDDKDYLMAHIRKALDTGGPYAQQFRVLRADGTYHWLEASGRVEMDEAGAAVTFPGVLIDISERLAVEAERDRVADELFRLNETLEQRVAEQTAALIAKEEELRQAQKMEAIGQLTGGVAHDFNNLLAAIRGSLDMVQTRIEQGRPDDLERYINAAQSAAGRAATLTQRLLAFSRRQSLDPKVTDLLHLTRGMEELVERTVGRHIEVQTFAEEDLWRALVDQNQLESALLNLCINARDAMPGGGQLNISLTNRRLAPAEAAELKLVAGDYVLISVTDSGSGMSAQDIARAFDPFFTTKPMGEGTGLGLSMVYGFVQQTGGHASIRSKLGQGTSVDLLLPRSEIAEEPVAVATDRATPLPPAATGATILVVEDEVLVRMVVVDALRDCGFEVIEAGSGPEALEVLKSEAAIDLLLTDIGLPKGMNGRQLAEIAREIRTGLKVIFATGYDESTAMGAGSSTSDIEVLHKPFDVDVLTSRVRSLLAD